MDPRAHRRRRTRGPPPPDRRRRPSGRRSRRCATARPARRADRSPGYRSITHHATARQTSTKFASMPQAGGARLLRMELGGEHVVGAERGVQRGAVLDGRGDDARDRRERRATSGRSTRTAPSPNPANIGSSRSNTSRFHCIWGIFGPGGIRRTVPGMTSSPVACSYSSDLVNNICIPTQIPRNGRPDATGVARRVLQSRAAQRVHARTERTDAGQHDAGGVTDQTGVGGEAGVGAARARAPSAPSGGCRSRSPARRSAASSLARFVPDPSPDDPRSTVRHSTPFVDGTPPGSSMRTASRSDRARPLNVASMM